MSEPIVDASRKRLIRIAEEDRDGLTCHPGLCPGANAVMRQVKGAQDVKVGASTVRVLIDGIWHRWDLSISTKEMIRAYDDVGTPMPAGVVLEFLPPARKLGARTGQPVGRKAGSGSSPGHVASRRPSLRNIFVEPPS